MPNFTLDSKPYCVTGTWELFQCFKKSKKVKYELSSPPVTQLYSITNDHDKPAKASNSLKATTSKKHQSVKLFLAALFTKNHYASKIKKGKPQVKNTFAFE